MDEQQQAEPVGRRKVPWPLGVGALLVVWITFVAVTNDGQMTPVGWFVGLLGLLLVAVGLLRRA